MSDIINNQSDFLSFIADEAMNGGNLSIRGVARCCGVEHTSIIRDAAFKSEKLAQMLEAAGFDALNLKQKGFPPQAVWLTIEYFAFGSKKPTQNARSLAVRFGMPPTNAAIKPRWKAESDHVYIVQCAKTHVIKIGVSNNPAKRLKTLQTAFPWPLQVVRTWRVGSKARQVERSLHLGLDDFRLNGEWFDGAALQMIGNLA